MTDKVDPVRGLELHLDRTRHLRFTLGALKRVEDTSGIRIHEQTRLAEWGRTLEGVTTFLWAGLTHEDPDLTLEQVYELVDISQFGEVKHAVDVALGLASPNLETLGNESPPPNRQERRHPPEKSRTRLTGTISGPSEPMISGSAREDSGALRSAS